MDVTHNAAKERFEIPLDGELAVLDYQERPGEIAFVHTGVPEPHEGRGVGTALVRAGLAYARSKGLKVIPRCSFVAAYMRRHKELAS